MTKEGCERGADGRAGTVVFILKGRFEAGQAGEVAAALASVDVSVRRVLLDLSAVTWIGPEALAVLERESGRVAVVIGDRHADVLHAIEGAGFAASVRHRRPRPRGRQMGLRTHSTTQPRQDGRQGTKPFPVRNERRGLIVGEPTPASDLPMRRLRSLGHQPHSGPCIRR